MENKPQNIFYISNNVDNIQIYNEETFSSRGFKCKISLVNTTHADSISKGGYEQKETVSIPYRYFKEKAMYLQDELKIPSFTSVSFVDFFKNIPIYMKKKYDEYNKPQGSTIVDKNKDNVSIVSNNESVVIEDKPQYITPLSEPIEKLKEDSIVNIEKITEIHPVQLDDEKREGPLEPYEREDVLKRMEGLDFLKIELEQVFENITEKKKDYKELEMMKDFIFFLIQNEKKIEIENEKTVIVKGEKGVVIIGELSGLSKDTEKMKQYFEKEKIKGTPLYKELGLI